jgi:(p)ppGpp synthase/HD superfamily hydrolase
VIQNESRLNQTATMRFSSSKSTGVQSQPKFGAAPILSSRFENALHLANQLHQTQLRKGTEIPYFAHLMGVASLVLEHGGTEDEAIAGILHDAVEDQGGQKTLQLIREQFGDTVADIVMGCTDADVIPKPPWKARKEAYIAHVATASPSVRLVSACDKLHNARAILNDYYQNGDKVWEKFKGGKEGTMWYYRSLVTEFKKHGESPLVQELDRTVRQLEAEIQKNQMGLNPQTGSKLKRAWQNTTWAFKTACSKTYQWTKQTLNWLWQGCQTLWRNVWPQPKATS